MKIAAVQMDVFFGRVEANAAKVVRHIGNLAQHGTQLVIFPEAALTGYCFDSLNDALEMALDLRRASALDEIESLCKSVGVAAVVGFAEREDDRLYNSIALLEPGADRKVYRKTHLPHLGMDRFTTPGDDLPVWETSLGNIGPLICFDLRAPEAARTLALAGAELLVLPTNWPEGAEASAEHIAISRAAENKMFVVTCNRVGTENGFRFIGKSKIIHCSGRVLAAGESFEVVLLADIDLKEAREKRTVVTPNEYEIEIFRSRRTNLYRC